VKRLKALKGAIPLSLILLTATIARFWGISFGLPHTQCRPDEMATTGMAMRFFGGDFNPYFFRYPTFYMYALHGFYRGLFIGGYLLGSVDSKSQFLSVPHLLLASRALSAVLGVATVVITYRVAQILFDRLTALVSSFFLSLAFLHVRDSHFGVTDVPLTFLTLSSFLVLAKADLLGRPSLWMGAGILAGLATSTKYSALLLVIPMAVALVLRGFSAQEAPRSLARSFVYFVVGLSVAFLAGTPFAVLDPSRFLGDVLAEADHLRQGHGVDLGRGWSYHLSVSLRFGLGWPVLAAALGSVPTLMIRDPRKALLFLAFPLSYYVAAGSGHTVFVRYMVPIIPFLCIAAGFFFVQLSQWLTRAASRPSEVLVAVLAGIAIFPSIRRVVSFDLLSSRTDTRLLAGRWFEQNVTPGSSLYQSGAIYGQLQVDGYRTWGYDEKGRRFMIGDEPTEMEPDWIVIQDYPLPEYCGTPRRVRQIITRHYRLARAFRAMEGDDEANVFDQQDAFFLPLTGFRGIERPGPNLSVYERRVDLSPLEP